MMLVSSEVLVVFLFLVIYRLKSERDAEADFYLSSLGRSLWFVSVFVLSYTLSSGTTNHTMLF